MARLQDLPGILLKVMAGDKFMVQATSWFNSSASPGVPVSPLTDLVTAFATSLGDVTSFQRLNYKQPGPYLPESHHF